MPSGWKGLFLTGSQGFSLPRQIVFGENISLQDKQGHLHSAGLSKGPFCKYLQPENSLYLQTAYLPSVRLCHNRTAYVCGLFAVYQGLACALPVYSVPLIERGSSQADPALWI